MADPRPSSPNDWRFDPFTESYNAVLISDEDRDVPGSSPYRIRLYEIPRKDSPSTVDCVILVELDEELDDSEVGVDILAAHYDRVQVGDVLLCDDEQMYVSAKPGSPTLTVTRAYGGTSADTHTDGTMMEILASMTEIVSGSPATREFRVDYKYSTGLILFNSAQAGYNMRVDYYGLGSPLSVLWILGASRALVGDINWATSGQSGTIAISSYVDVSLTAYSIFPSIVGAMAGDHLYMTPIDTGGGAADPATPEFRIRSDDPGNTRAYDVDWYYIASSAGPKMWAILDKNGEVQHIYHMEKAPHEEFFPHKFLKNVPDDGTCIEIEVTESLVSVMKSRRGKGRLLITVFKEDFDVEEVGGTGRFRLKERAGR